MKNTNAGLACPVARLTYGFVCLAVLAAAAGCTDGSAKKTATQVAAKVNGDEITVHQLNHALRGQNVAPEAAEVAKRQVLERLIDQQLAKQQAVEKRLDRIPATMQSIEAARNEILARAYLEQLAAGLPVPSDAEVKRYFADNPALFAERRIFGVEEINLSPRSAPAAFSDRVTRAADLREVASWLKSQNISFGESRGVRAAEQLPLDWLPRMQGMKAGEMQVFESGDRLYVVRLAAAQPAPVDEATARPRIQQFLSNRRLSEAISQAVKNMREKSNIEYMGEFAAGTAGEAASAQPVEPVDPIEKGIRGLVKR
jgi:EpsD family peptidyl-prolyl cis-trans isomerase